MKRLPGVPADNYWGETIAVAGAVPEQAGLNGRFKKTIAAARNSILLLKAVEKRRYEGLSLFAGS